ncbi:MAG: Asp23/Gls24 family envelope stress response protein [Oscillospiraceae bacterium]|nr:Asp23/Gls24 family envelope stress response protein [Oscillospiraceae bacterium]MDE5993532.1 Asp23/Gls24 family envelope stress response protein [Oscillospiraceae bacterium]MDE6746890.1 Asp23/Gls24 family envelope stress response protein [Oscillospiraceae bacterium]MDE7303818.1 Asp23/Gls24 family envelope stress response protein [Oscillospiraceae bacterium]
MLTVENHLGEIGISKECLSSLIGYTASKCFGVAGLNDAERTRGLLSVFKKADIGGKECVSLGIRDGKLVIGLHITVVFGTNIPTVADSLAHKIRYTVEDKTGLEVSRITIYVDGMKA